MIKYDLKTTWWTSRGVQQITMTDWFRKKDVNTLLAQCNDRKGSKTLGALDLTLLGMGAIIGTGVMVLTGLVAARDAGPAVILSFILAGIVCAFAALCYAEIASAVPVGGSAYTYAYITVGELVAHLMGWTLLAVYVLMISAVASGWTGYLNNILESFGIGIPVEWMTIPAHGGFVNLPAILMVLFMTWLLLRGTKESKTVNNIMVFVKLGVILLFIIVGSFYVEPANWTPFMPYGTSGVLAGAAAVFFAFLGFDAISTSAEDAKNPQRDMPKGIIGSLAISTVIYVLVCVVMTGMASYTELNVPEAMAHVLHLVGRNEVAGIIAIGAVIGMMAVVLAYIYAATRVMMTMSRDGLLPRSFTKQNKNDAPSVALWFIGGVSAFVAGFMDLKQLADLANIGALLTFVMVSLSVILLRRSHPNLKRGFIVPFMPLIPILSIASCVLLMANLPFRTWIIFGIWLVIGVVWYFVYAKVRGPIHK